MIALLAFGSAPLACAEPPENYPFLSYPAIAFDAAGSLHMVWVERETLDSRDGGGRATPGAVAEETPTRLRYAVGRFLK